MTHEGGPKPSHIVEHMLSLDVRLVQILHTPSPHPFPFIDNIHGTCSRKKEYKKESVRSTRGPWRAKARYRVLGSTIRTASPVEQVHLHSSTYKPSLPVKGPAVAFVSVRYGHTTTPSPVQRRRILSDQTKCSKLVIHHTPSLSARAASAPGSWRVSVRRLGSCYKVTCSVLASPIEHRLSKQHLRLSRGFRPALWQHERSLEHILLGADAAALWMVGIASVISMKGAACKCLGLVTC